MNLKVKKLEREIDSLRKNDKSIGQNINGLIERLEDEANYAQEVLPNMIRDNPKNVRFTMIDQANDKMGSYGSYRVQLIKSWFKIIIDNIIDDRAKAAIAWINNIPISKFLNVLKSMKNGKDKHKRFKISEENEFIRNLNGIQFSDGLMEESSKGLNTIK